MTNEKEAVRPARPQQNRKRRKVCQFCVDKAQFIDYKDTAKLKRYLSERSKILASALRYRLIGKNEYKTEGETPRLSVSTKSTRFK